MSRSFRLLLILTLFGLAPRLPATARSTATPNPILFITQMPVPEDFTTANSVFGNHRAALDSVGRGGDLYLRYPDGTLRNLTGEAGYGLSETQSIAVRDPSAHWDGHKALFSMVIGAPAQRYQVQTYHWQIYEVSGFGPGETAVITKLPNQPAAYNNISPIYGTDERILFTSDRPRNGAAHLHPQLDEYEEAPTVTGLWSLDPASGDLFMLNHTPSGAFTPIVDSFGRVIFTRWDHLQRDQQADTDAETAGPCTYCTFNYADESAGAAALNSNAEVFPEPRASRTDLLAGTNLAGHSFNIFQPWQINEDGTEEETLNHIGRHELQRYFDRSLTDNTALHYYYPEYFPAGTVNPNRVNNFIQLHENPAQPGDYIGIDAPEFTTHAAGQVISITAGPSVNPDAMRVRYVTHRDTASPSAAPSINHSGLYRDPLPLSDGSLVAAHTAQTDVDHNIGSTATPQSRYDFRLKTLNQSGAVWIAGAPLTAGISRTVSFWNPDVRVTYSGNLWELQPAEVRARPRPVKPNHPLPPPEQQMFAEAGVTPAELRAFMRANNLALMVTRNVTTRDNADQQQPFNLRVPAGAQTIAPGASGPVYDISALQIFQGDLIRGLHPDAPRGRRVLAQPLHDAGALAANGATATGDRVSVAADGSVAAFVPARRALSWQLLDPSGVPVVRERYWISLQAGEVRMCTSCHGLNDVDQAGHPPPTNAPLALKQLLILWKAQHAVIDVKARLYVPLLRR